MSKVKGVASFIKGINTFMTDTLEANPGFAGKVSTEQLKLDALKRLPGASEYGKMAPSTEEIADRLPMVREAFEGIPRMSRKPDEAALAVARQNADDIDNLPSPMYADELGMRQTIDESDILELLKSENTDDAMRASEQLRRQVANRQALYVPPTKLDEIPFYTRQAALNRMVADEVGIPTNLFAIMRGLGSPQIGPMGDMSRAFSAGGNVRMPNLFDLQISKNVPHRDYAVDIVTGLDDALKAGSFEDKIRFIQNKVFNYIGSMNEADSPILDEIINAKTIEQLNTALRRAKTHFKSYTVDTMDLRGASGLRGRNVIEISGNPLKEVLLSATGKSAAETAGALKPAFQAVTWFPARTLTSTTGKVIPASMKPLSVQDQTLLLKMIGNGDTLRSIAARLPDLKSSQRFAGQNDPRRTTGLGQLEEAIIRAIAGGTV